jgi:hypothetical protein
LGTGGRESKIGKIYFSYRSSPTGCQFARDIIPKQPGIPRYFFKGTMSPDSTSQNTTKICPTCGTRLGINATRCSVCGSNLAPTVSVATSKGVSGPRIPEVTLSLPILLVLIVLLLIIGAGSVYWVLRTLNGGSVVLAAASTNTPTPTNTATFEPTPTASSTPTLEPPILLCRRLNIRLP